MGQGVHMLQVRRTLGSEAGPATAEVIWWSRGGISNRRYGVSLVGSRGEMAESLVKEIATE